MRLVSLAAFLILAGLLLGHQQLLLSEQSSKPSLGKFLVATQKLGDPRFSERVVLIIHFDETGTVGLTINHPTKVALGSAFPDRKMIKRKNDLVYIGGPVDLKQVFWLIHLNATPQDQRQVPDLAKVFGDVYIGSGDQSLETMLQDVKPYEELRVYIGYAGWAPGQLEFEINTGL
jgi:putative transcriptional regulator